MELKEIINKKIWEDFSLSCSPNNFLQSWNWGEFNLSLGRQIYRWGVYKEGKLQLICLGIVQATKLGKFLYIPRGPILFDWNGQEIFEFLVRELKSLAKTSSLTFIKIEPPIGDFEHNRDLFGFGNFVPAVTFTQVEDAWLLDLTKAEAELLYDMRKTTRYLIRNEPKQGVKIEMSDRVEDAKAFVEMLYSTSKRKNFVNHPKDYYIKQFEILSKDNEMRIFKAVKDAKVLAMAMISFYGEMASYLHGASVQTEQSVGYSLQWAAITEAKRRGLKYYSFWGVVKDKNFYPGHPWYGFSLFKRGFGGFKYSYLRAQDLPLSPKYYLYRSAERARRFKNRLQSGYWED